MKKTNLAYFGGEKAITYSSPHWKWPPFSETKIKKIEKYYKEGEKKNKSGYPLVVEEFERNFAKYLNMKYSLSTNSGTSSLHAAFFAINLKKGDEVIVPAMTFHATASPIISYNAVPIICDCESDTGNIDPEDIIKKISSKTKAIVITHLCGHPCEMEKIIKIKEEKNLYLIEDCSHAHGSKYNGNKVGTFGDVACFSLDNNKLLAAGEGGILVTNSKLFFERALINSDFSERIKFQIELEDNKKFNETGLGFKHRIHPVSAIIANYELEQIDYYINKRNEVLNYFSKKIEKIPGISPPITRKNNHRGAFFGYRPFFNSKDLKNISIDNFMKILRAEGMEVRQSGNLPLHLLPLFSDPESGPKFTGKDEKYYKKYLQGDLPKSEIFYNSTISIPTFTFEEKKLIDQYISAFEKVCFFLSKNEVKI